MLNTMKTGPKQFKKFKRFSQMMSSYENMLTKIDI